MLDVFIGITVCALLFYGAIWDARKRVIPDLVPISIFIISAITIVLPPSSFWHIPPSERVAGFILPAGVMLLLYALGKPVGGGDFKLSAALGLLLGLKQFALAYAVGGVIALIWALVKKRKSVPLAVFLAIGVMVCLIL